MILVEQIVIRSTAEIKREVLMNSWWSLISSCDLIPGFTMYLILCRALLQLISVQIIIYIPKWYAKISFQYNHYLSSWYLSNLSNLSKLCIWFLCKHIGRHGCTLRRPLQTVSMPQQFLQVCIWQNSRRHDLDSLRHILGNSRWLWRYTVPMSYRYSATSLEHWFLYNCTRKCEVLV